MKWEKTITREMSLTAIYYATLSYTKDFKKVYGFVFNNLIYFNEEGKLVSYKGLEDIKNFDKKIREIAKKKKIRSFLIKAKKLNNEFFNLCNQFLRNKSKYTFKELLEIYKRIDKKYIRFWSYYLFHYKMGDALVNSRFKYVLNKNRDLIEELRKTNPYLFFEHFLNYFYEELSKRCKIKDKDLLFFLLPEEIMRYLEGDYNININELKIRKHKYLIYIKKGKTEFLTGDKAQKLFEKEIKEEKEFSSILKGFSAFKGKVKGPVRVVTRKDDFKKISNGDILVAHMTTVDYAPYLHKVLAIITDEGGILSHAAVIAREMKKPCVIGTKVATKVLKDGDYIEVDANKGVVKILKRK